MSDRRRKAVHDIPRSKKRKAVATEEEPRESEGSPFKLDRSRFLTKDKQARYLENQVRKILEERHILLRPGEWEEVQDEITKRKWDTLACPETKYNEELIREFYANAYPISRGTDRRVSWVRGNQIPYDRDAIDAYLRINMELGEDYLDGLTRVRKMCAFTEERLIESLCIPGTRFQRGKSGQPTKILRKDLKTVARIWQNFLFSNVLPMNHISDINKPRAEIICSILKGYSIDVAKIISDEMYACAVADYAGAMTKPLVFPALITGLLKRNKVRIPAQPLKPIRLPITAAYIKTHCVNPAENVAEPQPPQPPQPMSSNECEMIKRMLRSIHLGQVSLNESMHQLYERQYYDGPPFVWPSPDAFAAFVEWPEDRPQQREGQAAAAAADPSAAGREGEQLETEAEAAREEEAHHSHSQHTPSHHSQSHHTSTQHTSSQHIPSQHSPIHLSTSQQSQQPEPKDRQDSPTWMQVEQPVNPELVVIESEQSEEVEQPRGAAPEAQPQSIEQITVESEEPEQPRAEAQPEADPEAQDQGMAQPQGTEELEGDEADSEGTVELNLGDGSPSF